MKICITTIENNKDSLVDLRFGRCKYFAIYDDEAKKIDFISNPGIQSVQGAGVTAAQEILNINVDAVITGKVGPNAMKLFKGSNVKMYSFQDGTVEEAIEAFKENKLDEIINPAAAHSGMGNR